MRRFFIETIDPVENHLTITGSEARHIARVLRMSVGDQFVLMDSEGSRFRVAIEDIGLKEVTVQLLEPLSPPPPSPVEIVLCQSLIKAHHMDDLIEKTSQLGADRLVPFISQRSVVKLPPARHGDRLRHWRRIARSGAKQSDRSKPMVIDPPVSFHRMMEHLRGQAAGAKAILWEEETGVQLGDLLAGAGDRFIGVVGPEGGFHRSEIDLAKEAGFVPVSLGSRILRAETAAIALAAIVQFAWGDLGMTHAG